MNALVNVDVLDTVLLSLHPESKLKDLSLSDYAREGLDEMQQYHELVHLDTMAVKKNCYRPQYGYVILKEMYLDLKRMHYSFRVNRSWWHNNPKSDFSVQGPDNWEVPTHVRGGGRPQVPR